MLKGLEADFMLVLGERIYVDLVPAYWFGGCAGNNGCAALGDKYATYKPALVAPAPFFVDNASLKLSVGWRFLW